MANPQIPQGNLNRLRASIVVANNPGLNITPPFLGKDQISLSLDTAVNTPFETSTGLVNSPEPYQKATVTAHLVKSQALASAWKSQIETLALIGNLTIYPDTATLTPYPLANCSIVNVSPMKFDGSEPTWTIMFTGIYYVNSQLWNF